MQLFLLLHREKVFDDVDNEDDEDEDEDEEDNEEEEEGNEKGTQKGRKRTHTYFCSSHFLFGMRDPTYSPL